MKENLLLNAAKLIVAINDNPDNQSHPIKLDPKAYEQLTSAISLEEWREQLAKDDITLHIRDTGDRHVGIGAGEISITLYKGLVDTPESREEIRQHFIDAAKQIDILQFPVVQANFSDECPDCNSILVNEKIGGSKETCPNKNCIVNL